MKEFRERELVERTVFGRGSEGAAHEAVGLEGREGLLCKRRGTCYRIRIGSISNHPEVLIPALRSLSSSSKLVDDKAPSIVPRHV